MCHVRAVTASRQQRWQEEQRWPAYAEDLCARHATSPTDKVSIITSPCWEIKAQTRKGLPKERPYGPPGLQGPL